MLDLLIAGAGPAGLATAIAARQRGLSCLVLEKGRLPQDKACGEGLMPAGVRALAELGVELPAGQFMPLSGVCYSDGRQTARARFAGTPALGVRRPVLSRALVDRARAAGARLHEGARVRSFTCHSDRVEVETGAGLIEARLLVGADGLHSQVRARSGLDVATGGQSRRGTRRHARLRPWSSWVEVHWAAGAEAYVTPVAPELVGVAILFSGEPERFETLLGRFPGLAERLAGVEYATPVRGAGPFPRRAARLFADRVVLVGDAAGYVDPLTGEGIALALRGGQALVASLRSGGGLTEYAHRHAQLVRAHQRATRALLFAAVRPRLRRRLLAALAASPETFGRLLEISAGEAPLRSLGVGGAVRLLAGLL